MSTMKLPANYASISEEEMVYLDGGASDAYNSFLNIGKVFNAIALFPLWGQFFLFLMHFQSGVSGVIVYIKGNNFFILWQKNAQKKHFCYASVAHVVLTYRVEVYPSNWRCHAKN